MTGIRAWTLPYFVNLVAYAIVLYLLAGLLLPVRGADVVDFRVHFEANRPRFFALLLGFQVVDVSDRALERSALGTDWNVVHLVSVVVFSVLFLVGMRTGNRSYHGFVAVARLLTCLGWAFSGIATPIVAP